MEAVALDGKRALFLVRLYSAADEDGGFTLYDCEGPQRTSVRSGCSRDRKSGSG
jgi:hypothetical protein